MPRKPIELPAGIARAFAEDMRAFFVEPNAIKRDEIAARQLYALKQHYTGKLRLFKWRITLDAHQSHRPPHHHVHAANRGICPDLEYAWPINNVQSL